MIPATDKARLLRYKLQRLAESGVEGERDNARAKLARIETRWDFTGPAQADSASIFAGVVYHSRGNSRPVVPSFRSSEIASFVKWALQIAYALECSLRTEPGKVTILVEAAPESMQTVNHVAALIAAAFEALWAQFSALPGSTPQDAKTFLLGLYDGMMDDERATGTLLPQREQSPVKTKGRKRSLAIAPGVATLRLAPEQVF